MLKCFLKIMLAAGLTCASAGCKYDQSFMQLDSNSGVPFFGLQWAVSSQPQPRTAPGHTAPGHNADRIGWFRQPERDDTLSLQSRQQKKRQDSELVRLTEDFSSEVD